MHCGGSKVLTEAELEKLPPEQREKALINNIKKEPMVSNNYILLANLYLKNDEPDKAFLVLQKGKKEIPGDARLSFMFGQLAIKQGNLKEGYKAFIDVLNSPDAYNYKENIASYVQEKYMVKQLTTDPSDDAYPVFTNNGEEIFFQSNRNGNWDIYKYNIVNQELTQVTNSPADEELPWVSSDGKTLYYTSDELDKRPLSYLSKSRNIFKLDLVNNKKEALTTTLVNDWLPRTNDQNTLIVFISDREDLRNVALEEKYSHIFTMELTGDFQSPIVSFDAKCGGAIFSHDGNYIYFHTNKDGKFGIYRYSLNTQKIVGILNEPGNDNVAPFVSPDDSSLVFFSNRDGNYELYKLQLSTNQLERLTSNPADDLNPAYSPDGSKIVFFSNRSGNYDIYLLDLTQPASTITLNDLIATLNNLVKNM